MVQFTQHCRVTHTKKSDFADEALDKAQYLQTNLERVFMLNNHIYQLIVGYLFIQKWKTLKNSCKSYLTPCKINWPTKNEMKQCPF